MPYTNGSFHWSEGQFRSRTIKLFRKHEKLGAYVKSVDQDGKQYGYTQFEVYVAKPTDINHKVEPFFRMWNPKGQCFVRLPLTELQKLRDMLDEAITELPHVLASAADLIPQVVDVIVKDTGELGQSLHVNIPLENSFSEEDYKEEKKKRKKKRKNPIV